jgi:hypothetical protein
VGAATFRTSVVELGKQSVEGFRLLTFGCWPRGLTPGGARKIVAGGKRFDVSGPEPAPRPGPRRDRVMRGYCLLRAAFAMALGTGSAGRGLERIARPTQVNPAIAPRAGAGLLGRVGTRSTRRRWSAPARFSRSRRGWAPVYRGGSAHVQPGGGGPRRQGFRDRAAGGRRSIGEGRHTFNPAAVVRTGKVFAIGRAEDS